MQNQAPSVVPDNTDAVLVSRADAFLNNYQSTWTDPTPATVDEQEAFDKSYVPMLSQSFIHELYGGVTEVEIVDDDLG
jgi:hypothetical protein